ncbi:cyanophycinase [Gemmata sp.]|uniref:cyanophycinase n=1 Tax=Gemmata sp. TaxID=1914242 RepID=UPI003F71302F
MRDAQKNQRKLGPLVLIGGAEDRTGEARVLWEFVRLAGGAKGRLVVVTVASEEPVESGLAYLTAFRRLGVKDVHQLDVPDRAHATAPPAAAHLDAATGVFFTGGDQLRITNLLGGTPLDAALHRRRAEGVVIGGTSAGAAMMSGTMIVGGANEGAPRAGAVEVGPGMDLLRGVMVDQHFTRRGRTGRLLAALARYPHLLGVGIDEDTALIADGAEFRVVGSGAVTVLDLGTALASNALELTAGQHLGICDVRMHVLPEGYRFRLTDRTPLPPAADRAHARAAGNDAGVRRSEGR